MKPVAKIDYTNTAPFFDAWDEARFPLLPGAPRPLAGAVREGRACAGPLPVSECWALEPDFTPLGAWGIAVNDRSRSVFVLAHVPLSRLNGAKVGLTGESSASVRLFDLLVRERYGHAVETRRGFREDDDARLVIGDQALAMWAKNDFGSWTVVTDLTQEWWSWTGLPFVPARWVADQALPAGDRDALLQELGRAYEAGLPLREAMAVRHGKRLDIPPAKVLEYLAGFTYAFGERELASLEKFRALAHTALSAEL